MQCFHKENGFLLRILLMKSCSLHWQTIWREKKNINRFCFFLENLKITGDTCQDVSNKE